MFFLNLVVVELMDVLKRGREAKLEGWRPVISLLERDLDCDGLNNKAQWEERTPSVNILMRHVLAE